MRFIWATDPDLTYYHTRTMLRANKLSTVLTNAIQPLAGRQVHAPVYKNGAVVNLYPTINVNPNKQSGQPPRILRYPTEDDKSDEEMDLRNDDPTQLRITLDPLRGRPPLLHRHDTILRDLRQRFRDSDTHPTSAYLGVHIAEVHPDIDIDPSGAWTLTKHPIERTQDVNTLIQIDNPGEIRWVKCGRTHSCSKLKRTKG